MKEIVRKIINDVRKNGDTAANKYSMKFDSSNIYEVSKKEIKKAYSVVDKKTINAIKKAAKNIKTFSSKQIKQLKPFKTVINNNTIEQKVIPIQRIGCYVPGGNYPLPSSALMSVIPAKVAGVEDIIVCSPKINPIIIIAADIAGANRIFSVGGIQAIAAMAYGTKTIPKVDKIVGPGNKYVTEAKKAVYGDVGIDFIAGPSEIMIIADDSANIKYIASDILAQAEHDYDAKMFLVTTSNNIVRKIKKELKIQLSNLKTKIIVSKSIKNLKIILTKDIEKAIYTANNIAPEHLELQIRNSKKVISKLKNYGSLFIGNNSAEVFGDYCIGTNHILPTNGAARYTGGLSVFDFVKIVTAQKITKEGVKRLADTAIKLAEIEGLDAHKKSAELRRKNYIKPKR